MRTKNAHTENVRTKNAHTENVRTENRNSTKLTYLDIFLAGSIVLQLLQTQSEQISLISVGNNIP